MAAQAPTISISGSVASFLLVLQLIALTISSPHLVSARFLAEDGQPLAAAAPAVPDAAQTSAGPVTPVPSEADAHILTFFMHDILGGLKSLCPGCYGHCHQPRAERPGALREAQWRQSPHRQRGPAEQRQLRPHQRQQRPLPHRAQRNHRQPR